MAICGSKIQTKTRVIKSGKNIGKTNETSIEQQAILEFNSLVQKQKDLGYVEDIKDYQELLRPMLAHVLEDKAHLLDFKNNDYYASKKLDGLRCFIFIKEGKVEKFESRTGKPFKFFYHIAEELETMLKEQNIQNSFILDGELFNKQIPFVVLCSLINSEEYVEVVLEGLSYLTKDVQFHMYDLVDLNKRNQTYEERFLSQDIFKSGDKVICCENIIVQDLEDLKVKGLSFMDEGYEGLMLRLGKGVYDFSVRSVNLLKYKIMKEEEFKILDIIESEQDPFQPILVISVSEDITCNVRLKGAKEENSKILEDRSNYIGKWLTVQYQAKTAYGNLSFPVGLRIREGVEEEGVFIPSY